MTIYITCFTFCYFSQFHFNRADVNLPNRRSLWTPIISAAFQGHGKIIMKLMEYNPDLSLTDNQGRLVSFPLRTVWKQNK